MHLVTFDSGKINFCGRERHCLIILIYTHISATHKSFFCLAVITPSHYRNFYREANYNIPVLLPCFVTFFLLLLYSIFTNLSSFPPPSYVLLYDMPGNMCAHR